LERRARLPARQHPKAHPLQSVPLPSLHRCLERHGLSRLPESPDKSAKRGTFAETAIGYAPIDISERRLAPDYAAPGKLNMFLAIDRVSGDISPPTSSTASAMRTASSTSSPSPAIRGPMAKPSG